MAPKTAPKTPKTPRKTATQSKRKSTDKKAGAVTKKANTNGAGVNGASATMIEKELSKQPTEDSPGELTDEEPKEPTADKPKEVTDEMPKDVDEMSKGLTDELSKGHTVMLPKDLTDKSYTQLTDVLPKDAPKEASVNPAKKRASPEPIDEPARKKSKSKEEPVTPIKSRSPSTPTFPSAPDEPASKHDQETWRGFCEIASEPAYFSVMLREMGVQNVTVREVHSLDDLDDIPQPIYSLVLCFRARQVNPENEEEQCPPNVWFANQLPAQNSCATLAMINTLMNCPEVELGEHLKQFQAFTSKMMPSNRGESLASFDFVRNIHNSFATKQDILENDAYLAGKVQRSEYRKKMGINPKRRGSESSNDSATSFEDNAHHYIPFVPIDDELWKLDGMDAQPTCMGACDEEDWRNVAADAMRDIMQAGKDNDYNILAIAKAPLDRLRKDLCSTVAEFKHTKSRLAAINTDWAPFVPVPMEGINAEEPITPTQFLSLGILEGQLEAALVSAGVKDAIDSENFESLMSRVTGLVEDLVTIRDQIFDEMEILEKEDREARERRTDLGPAIKLWLEFLADNGWLEQNLGRFMPKK